METRKLKSLRSIDNTSLMNHNTGTYILNFVDNKNVYSTNKF